MHFEAKKVIVVGGSAGIGRQAAADVVAHGGSAVIIGRSKERVDDTVAELTRRSGQAWGIAAELTDRAAIADVRRALSDQHSDATLLVNAAGIFTPRPFLEYDQQFYDSFMELNYALFFLTQTVVAGMIFAERAGPSSTSAACGHIRPSAVPHRRVTRCRKQGYMRSPTTWLSSLPGTTSASTRSHPRRSKPCP